MVGFLITYDKLVLGEGNRIIFKWLNSHDNICEKWGLASSIANSAQPITSDFQVYVEELKRAIPRMQRLGTRYIRVMSYPNDGISTDEWSKETFRRMKELVRLVMPSIDAGNMLAKSFAFLGCGDTVGVHVGAKRPVVLTSRAEQVLQHRDRGPDECVRARTQAQDR